MASIIKVDTIQDATGAFEHARLVQVVSTTTGAYTSGTTVIVTDDSIPTSSEGNAFPNLDTAITPTHASNKLLIEVDLFCGCSAAATDQMSVFQDSGSAALATTSQFQSQTNGMVQLSLAFMMVSGTTSSTTFKVRAGADGGTFAINGTSGRFFGGKGACTMTVSEIRV
jgi:hypothetical protein